MIAVGFVLLMFGCSVIVVKGSESARVENFADKLGATLAFIGFFFMFLGVTQWLWINLP